MAADLKSLENAALRLIRLLSLAVLASLPLVGSALSAQADPGSTRVSLLPSNAAPTLQLTGPIPSTAASYPFNSFDHNVTPIDLASAGYVEEEYIVSGTANLYGWEGTSLSIQSLASGPYTTRFLVRKPTSQSRFSGSVVVEALNPSYGFDLDYIWAAGHTQFLARGDAWVGITVKPTSIASLSNFDPARYGALSMANPLPPSQTCSNLPPDFSPTTEQGLEWDMITQVGATVRSSQSPGPFGGLSVQQVYAAGYSRGANDVTTYANAFGSVMTLPNGNPIFDGYLLGAAVGGPTTLSQCATWFPPGDPHAVIQPNRVPIIRVNTQSDFGWWFAAPTTGVSAASTLDRRPDSDEVGDQFRLYEFPGASHLWRYPEQFFPSSAELARINAGIVAFTCSDPVADDFPLQYFLNGALVNLDHWARLGAPPVRGERITLNNPGTSAETTVFDQWGNAMGGVRSPYLDLPTATYVPFSGGAGCSVWGHKTPFAPSLLAGMYPNGSYLSQVTTSANRLVAAGWVSNNDAQSIIGAAQQATVASR